MEKNELIIKISGGLGNKIFMLFCGLSLSIDYNLNPILDLNSNESVRNQFTKYLFFNSQNLIKCKYSNYNKCIMIKEKSFTYNKIILEPKKNYFLNQEQSGYFQSYKYFWHNKEIIKKYFYIDYEKISKSNNFIKTIGDHIAIHLRLTDYTKLSDYHYNINIIDYINILSKYDLKNIKILLFSDDVKLALEMLTKYVKMENIVLANTYSEDDEEQLYLLMCTKIRICANSTYSLWSCYLNEMYNFNENSIYYIPSKWFGIKGPKYNIYDLIPENNLKFKLMEHEIKNNQKLNLKQIISSNLNGRLGNYLFIIISTWSYAKKFNLDYIMDNSFKSNKYYNTFFSNIKTENIKSINFKIKKNFTCFENCLNYTCPNVDSNIYFNGYLQNYNNFDLFRNDVLKNFFNIHEPLKSNNNFFIHIRLTDFLTSKIHNINLDNYYFNSIEYAKTIIDFQNSNIFIISDDIEKAKIKYYLELLPQKNLVFIDITKYDEVKTFEIFKNCYLGCICGNSSFAWWGAYIINNPSKLVIMPNKFLNTNDDFKGMYVDGYKIINV